jgi:phenylpyruvate tautomerase PptA (4-oxalocrotonate tautomerase family)
MPLVTVTVRGKKPAAFKNVVLESVHGALVGTGVPPADLFQRVLELDSENFRFDPAYPDVRGTRSEDFVLVEILWSVGRSVKVKRKLLEALMSSLSGAGLDPENVMVVFKETSWENWAFTGGRILHAA